MGLTLLSKNPLLDDIHTLSQGHWKEVTAVPTAHLINNNFINDNSEEPFLPTP